MNAFARSTLPVINVLGYVVMIFAATMVVPLMFALVGGDKALRDYDIAVVVTAGSGLLLVLLTRRYRRELQPRDGFLLVTLVWTVLPAFATLPLMLHLPGTTFTRAYFEAMAGLTTTGATVLSGLDQLAAVDQRLAPPAAMARRHGNPRSRRRDPAPAGRRRRAGVQGGDRRTLQGVAPDAADRRHREGAVPDLLCALAGVHASPTAGAA